MTKQVNKKISQEIKASDWFSREYCFLSDDSLVNVYKRQGFKVVFNYLQADSEKKRDVRKGKGFRIVMLDRDGVGICVVTANDKQSFLRVYVGKTIRNVSFTTFKQGKVTSDIVVPMMQIACQLHRDNVSKPLGAIQLNTYVKNTLAAIDGLGVICESLANRTTDAAWHDVQSEIADYRVTRRNAIASDPIGNGNALGAWLEGFKRHVLSCGMTVRKVRNGKPYNVDCRAILWPESLREISDKLMGYFGSLV